MGMDLQTIAENRFDEIEAGDGDGGDPNPNQSQGEDDPVNNNSDDAAKDGESDVNKQKTNQEGEEETYGKPSESGDSTKDGEEDQKTPELTDEQLLAEIEKRGIAKKEDDKKSEDDKPTEVKRPEELPEKVWETMNPVQRVIYDQLPYVNIQGKDGEVIQVKTPEQLPNDFEFANARAEAQFNTDMSAQSYKAEKMYERIQTEVQSRQQVTATQAESRRVVADVDKLQSEGVVPKIVAKQGTPEFDNDPGVIRANEILVYRDELRAKGDDVSVYVAGKLFKAEHPDLYAPKQAKGDTERKQVSRNIAGGGRGDQSQSNNKRPIFRPGTTAADIVDYYDGQLD